MNEPELFPFLGTIRTHDGEVRRVRLPELVRSVRSYLSEMGPDQLRVLRGAVNNEHLRRSKLQVKRTELSEFVEGPDPRD